MDRPKACRVDPWDGPDVEIIEAAALAANLLANRAFRRVAWDERLESIRGVRGRCHPDARSSG